MTVDYISRSNSWELCKAPQQNEYMYYAMVAEGKIQERRGFRSSHAPPLGNSCMVPASVTQAIHVNPQLLHFFCFFYLSFLWFGLCQIGSLSTTPWGMLWRFSVWKRLSSWVVGSRPDAVPQSWTRARLKWVWMSLNSGSPHQPQQNGTVAEPCCFWHTASTSVALCSQNLKFHWEPLVLLEYSWRLTLASWNYDQQRKAVSTTGHFYMPALNWCLPATEAMMLPGGAVAGQYILQDFL